MKFWWLMLMTVGLGCGSEVVIVDENGEVIEVVGEGWGDFEPTELGCSSCAEDDCGLCSGLSGADFRCDAHRPPIPGCHEMGSLFSDGAGHYVCWSCD